MANVIFGKKDIKFTKTPAVKRKKKNQPTIDENIYIGIEEPISKSKRLKITQFKQPTGKGRPKQSTRGSEWPAMNLVTSHASPKMWDMFERFQNFTKRKVLTRHSSGLLESGDEAVNLSQSNANTRLVHEKNKIEKGDSTSDRSNTNIMVTESSVDNKDESLVGGDSKRRCIEIPDYEDGLESVVKQQPQPASAFKPKCLNFDDIHD